jgi:hypothetical protein
MRVMMLVPTGEASEMGMVYTGFSLVQGGKKYSSRSGVPLMVICTLAANFAETKN